MPTLEGEYEIHLKIPLKVHYDHEDRGDDGQPVPIINRIQYSKDRLLEEVEEQIDELRPTLLTDIEFSTETETTDSY